MSVIVAGARTPMGRLLGAFKGLSAADLGGVAIKAALERSGVSPDQVDYVIMGQVLQAGTGQITARQAAVKAGIGMEVPALTINKVCLSGIDAIALADVSDQTLVTIELGYGIIGLVDEEQGAPLITRITGIRKQLSRDLGFVLPQFRIRDSLDLAAQDYAVLMGGVSIARGQVRPGKLLAIDAGEVRPMSPGGHGLAGGCLRGRLTYAGQPGPPPRQTRAPCSRKKSYPLRS